MNDRLDEKILYYSITHMTRSTQLPRKEIERGYEILREAGCNQNDAIESLRLMYQRFPEKEYERWVQENGGRDGR